MKLYSVIKYANNRGDVYCDIIYRTDDILAAIRKACHEAVNCYPAFVGLDAAAIVVRNEHTQSILFESRYHI